MKHSKRLIIVSSKLEHISICLTKVEQTLKVAAPYVTNGEGSIYNVDSMDKGWCKLPL